MAARNYSNIAVETTLNSGIGSGDSSLVVAAATGWPAAPFAALLDEGEETEELVLVGAKSGTTFSSLTRAYGGTSAAAHSGGTTVKLVVTAEDLALIWEHVHDGADDTATISHDDLADLASGDPHTMYLKEKASGGVASEVAEHDHSGSSQAGLLAATYATDSEVTTAANAAEAAAEATAAAALASHAGDADAHHNEDHAARHADGGADELSVTDLADYPALPRGVLGYVLNSTVQNGITSETDLTSMSVAVTAGSGRVLKATIEVPWQPAAAVTATLRLKEGSTTIQSWVFQTEPTGQTRPHHVTHVFEPTSGAHTYKLSLASTSTGVSRGSDEALLLIEDIGLA